MRPDGKSAATLLPPAFGLAGINLHTYGGWGSVPYWNAFVAVLEMQGQGNFYDPRLDDAERFPIAAKNKFGHVKVENDRVVSTRKCEVEPRRTVGGDVDHESGSAKAQGQGTAERLRILDDEYLHEVRDLRGSMLAVLRNIVAALARRLGGVYAAKLSFL